MAEVRFTDKDGTFVKAQSSLIDYQPLMPGQTSAFKVMTVSNPQIWHFSFGFREMFGGAPSRHGARGDRGHEDRRQVVRER